MIKLIRTYLLQNQSVSIPGLGTIYIERMPAHSDFVNRQILPPSYHYRFDKYFDTPTKEFFTFLSARKNIQDFDAIKMFNEWALDLRSSISTAEQSAELEGIGYLKRDAGGAIVFEPSVKPQVYSPTVPAERIIRTNAKHMMLVGDKEITNVEMSDYLHEETRSKKPSWWVYALIIAAVCVIAIAIFYYINGSASPFGNQQKIPVR
jgi:hypothetical protein